MQKTHDVADQLAAHVSIRVNLLDQELHPLAVDHPAINECRIRNPRRRRNDRLPLRLRIDFHGIALQRRQVVHLAQIATRQHLAGVDKTHLLEVSNETDRITARTAAMAIIKLTVRDHLETRRLVLMERAARLPLFAGLLQVDAIALDHINDIDRAQDFIPINAG